MKVLLYAEGQKVIGKSGLGKAIKHQQKALEMCKIPYTLDKKDDYDILHINTYGPSSYLLAKNAKKKGKTVVYHAHSTEEDFKNSFILSNQISPYFKKWIMKCYNLGDFIITPTPYAKKLLESYGIKKEIAALSNGIDLSFFDGRKTDEFRKKFNYKKNDKVILGIGLFLERKGILDFVELAKRMPEYKFIWFGHSPLSASPKKIREAVNTKLSNLLFAGYQEPTMVRAALSECDLYIFPTLEETEGIPIIEACAMHCDAIVRDIKVFDGWLEDGKNVYKAKDVDEFEIKIKKILKKELPSLTEKAYEVAKERDIKEIGKKLKRIYAKALKEKTHV